MSGEPMSDERLDEIETRNRTLRVPWPYTLELIAEVRRLRAEVAEMYADLEQDAKATVDYDRVQNARIAVLTAERDSFQWTANFWCDRAQEAQAERDAARNERDAALARVAELEADEE
jgi:hypothetical protein